MMEHDNLRKKNVYKLCVTESPCCRVEKKKLYWGNENK